MVTLWGCYGDVMGTSVIWKQDVIYLYVLNLEYVTYICINICAYEIYTNTYIYIYMYICMYVYVAFIFVFP